MTSTIAQALLMRTQLAQRARRIRQLEKALREMTNEVGHYLMSVKGDPDMEEQNAGLWKRYEHARKLLEKSGQEG